MKIIFAILVLFSILYLNLKDETYNDETLYLGSSIPKTGIMKEWGSAVYSGANAYFSHVNNTQLLGNKKIELITYDDKYEPEHTLKNIMQLIETDNVFALFGFVGTPIVKKILPILEESNIPFIAPFTGASFLRDHSKETIVNFRSSYQEEINRIVDYLYKKGTRRFSVFYQNDKYGEDGYIALLKALDKKKLNLVSEGTYKRNTLSIRHAFNEIKESKPEAIIMVGAYKANALFIKTAKKNKNFEKTIFCNISFGDANEMIKELDFKTSNILFSQVVPSYNNYSKKVILEYKNLMKKYYPDQPLGFISLESFLAAKTVVNALRSIKGNITREVFLDKIKSLPKNQLGEFNTTYKSTQHINKVYLFEYKNSKFTEVYDEN